MKWQRHRPQNCDSSWSCKLDREETAKPHVAGQYENVVNTVQNAGGAKKVLTPLQPEAQHLINIENKDASCTWQGLANTPTAPGLGVEGFAFEVVCGGIVGGVPRNSVVIIPQKQLPPQFRVIRSSSSQSPK